MKDATLADLLSRHLGLARENLIPRSTEVVDLKNILARVTNLLHDLHLCPSAEPSILLLETRLRTLQQQSELLARDLQAYLVEALVLALQTLRLAVNCEQGL
ncbi:hypothetical protein GO988_15835 [Hymenobacter sp. HMF4947]|uniref:Uncharacterized protein n=1 Tax=Hymenobacter ginkgonis TaxID=2682976 RepID=A0A7K1THH3_9BACT|nr:hypothetical protein [Hymenobacter ginkgonis]MVN77802.1 hypothetical protein [Hymenobacter ginkgonis]